MTARIVTCLAALLLLLAAAATPALSQTEAGDPLPQPLAGWDAELDRIEESLERAERDDNALTRLREELEDIRQKSLEYIAKLKAQFDAVDSQLKKLGPAPKPEEPAESEAAAKLRAELSGKVAELDGAVRTAEVLQTRAAQLSGGVQESRRVLFSRQLLKRVHSPLHPDLWRRVSEDAQTAYISFNMIVTNWWRGLYDKWLFAILVVGAATLWAVLRAFSGFMTDRYRAFESEEAPPMLRRTASAAGVTVARSLPPVAAAVVLVFAMTSLEMLDGVVSEIAIAALKAFCLAVPLMALVKTLLAPNQPQWRIVPAGDSAAKKLRWLGWAIIGIFAANIFFSDVNSAMILPIELTVAQSFIVTIAIAVLVAAMLSVELDAPGDGVTHVGPTARALMRGVLWLFVVAILCAAALGYVALARFLTAQIVVTGSILILFYLLHITIEDFATSFSDPQRPTGRWMTAHFQIPQHRQSQVALITSLVLHLIILAIFVPLIALQWGFDWEDLRVSMSKVLFGFEIGNWRISPVTVIAAALLFVLGLVASGLFQRWLDARVLARAQLDQGARSAIRTGVGYLGVAIAALLAVSYAGLDFSNVAIVAGALSVGIGFGLQSIVNNFVSGLILLAERRISVGDWIVVGTDEGYVRRISVRATEIETFDRNFVIIPNSELMSNPVKNWTFQHRRARIIIDIGVAYDSDPEQVKEILLRIAGDHPAIIDHDKINVWIMDFADSAIIFRLKTFVGDVTDMLNTRSDLRFAIMREFREAGIEIPFPQQDVHLKDIDRLEAAILGKTKASPRRTRTQK